MLGREGREGRGWPLQRHLEESENSRITREREREREKEWIERERETEKEQEREKKSG